MLFQAPNSKIRYHHAGTQLAALLPNLVKEIEGSMEHHIVLWMVLVTAMSLMEPEEVWLSQCWSVVGRWLTWAEVKARVERVFWVPALFDEDGKKTVEILGLAVGRERTINGWMWL